MFTLFARPINMKQISENEFEWDIKKSDTPDTNKSLSSRRDFLKKLWLVSWWAIILGSWSKLLYDILTDDSTPNKQKESIQVNINSLRDKPIHLWYQAIVKDKDIAFLNNTWSKFSMLSRVSRCLRWKPLTDVVEDRYWIPRWLLMAMMAQEWMWDPTMPNLSWDGGLGLIHIQAINAHDFGLKTLPRFTKQMRDTKHGNLIKKKLKDNKYDLSKLVEYDDRFHPVMAVDVAARFLMDCKRRAWNWTDARIHALRYYSWRWYSWKWWYGYNIIEYRSIINDITWDWFPKNFSKNIYKDIQNCKKQNSSIKQRLNNLEFVIDWEKTWYDWYLAYFEESMQNFELQRYMQIGTYTENIADKGKRVPVPKDRETIPENTLIKSEFVDTKQHNSQWFRLFRYQVKKWDTPLIISDRFDERDKSNWDKYANTGNLNIVQFNWDIARHIKEWNIVYIKVRKN